MTMPQTPGKRRERAMAPIDRVRPSPFSAHAYSRDAGRYDARTARYDVYRRRAIARLPLSPGDVVADVGCGTGLCFEQLVDRVGPQGTVVGVEPAAGMRALAAERIADHGW